jgi:hypothetical protein
MSKTTKVVINTCFGGYSLSAEAYEYLGLDWEGYGYEYDDDRANPDLVRCVEELGFEKASGGSARLAVVEIPSDVDWCIEKYNGKEWIAEVHRTWS